jgi:holo-[acyl-carrier protein] synthase
LSIVGIGTDIVAVARLEVLLQRHRERFLNRCFREGESLRATTGEGRALAVSLAGRWAAKEAYLKALGQDVRGIPYRDIEVRRPQGGPPGLILHGLAERALLRCGGPRVFLTISHEREYAVATVLLDG